MNAITWVHIAAGMAALALGAVAMATRKGGAVHVSLGRWFCVAMLVLGITAAILSPFKSPPESPVGGLMVCYFVVTAWRSARVRDGIPGRFDRVACAFGLLLGVAILGAGIAVALAPVPPSAPPGAGPLIAVGMLCLFAGVSDLRWLRRGMLSPAQRISRHLWRMSFAFFIATGSFFLGQQDVMPQAVRGSPVLIVLAVAPIALMLFWLARVRRSDKYVALRLGAARD